MSRARRGLTVLIAAALLGVGLPAAELEAHSASDAYLNLHVVGAAPGGLLLLTGQWDIALRDLDFVLQLDADRNGHLTWGEVRARQAAITAYAFQHLQLRAGAGTPCAIAPRPLRIDEHADGAYAALAFDVTCRGAAAKLALDYRLFFAVDPSHRGIFVFDSGSGTATAVLSPEHTTLDLPL
jgi:hypothetical protein